MTFVDIDGLTTAQAELWRAVSEMNAERPGSWLCFVNDGHSMESAKALYDRGLIDATMQMGMPVCRVRPPVEDSCGCVFCDLDLEPTYRVAGTAVRVVHQTKRGDVPCTKPR